MGLAPQKPRLAGVKLVFIGFFLAYKPLYMDCTFLHNGGRSTVWYAYLKEECAVILCDLLLFNFPCRGRSDSASAGRVPAEVQFTTDKGINGRLRVFSSPFSKRDTYGPQNDRSEEKKRNLSTFGPLVAVLVK